MEKFCDTQGFNNFIEDSFKNEKQKTPISFFKTNLNVYFQHSYKTLLKEQNSLIEKQIQHFANPVKFDLRRIQKNFKERLLEQNKD